MRKVIIYSFLGALGFYLYQNLKALKNIETYIVGFDVSGGLLNLKIDLKLEVSNPTNYDINFQSLDANVFIDNNIIGNIFYNNPIILEKGQSKFITVPVVINPLFAAGSFIDQISKGSASIEVKGVLRAENINTKYFETYKIA